MPVAAFGGTPFSTDVELWLERDGQRIALSQVGPSYIVTRAPTELPPGSADVVVSVDGKPRRRTVFLHAGIAPSSLRAETRPWTDPPF